LLLSVSSAIGGKVLHISAKAAKTGKLYASVTEDVIRDTLKSEYGIEVPSSAITLKDHIKTAGTHTVTLTVGASSSTLTIDVKADVEKPAKAA
jgi:ribosomal protein L9